MERDVRAGDRTVETRPSASEADAKFFRLRSGFLNRLSLELSDQQFRRISRIVQEVTGIHLHEGKRQLVKSRLLRRLRVLGLPDFESYLSYLRADTRGIELGIMIEALTTNKTSFFREPRHFEFLRAHLLPRLGAEPRPLRFWCAGCSSGEEAYSMAILIRETIPDVDDRDIRILGTDISAEMIAKAREGVYGQAQVAEVSKDVLQRYFSPVRSLSAYRVSESVRRLVHFARLNLMAPWPMHGPFAVIFCRNVMIYFDRKTRQQLIHRFWEMLEPDGHLFLGHSESMVGLCHQFQYVQPSIYRKRGI